jgi:hypothetical protein
VAHHQLPEAFGERRLDERDVDIDELRETVRADEVDDELVVPARFRREA